MKHNYCSCCFLETKVIVVLDNNRKLRFSLFESVRLIPKAHSLRQAKAEATSLKTPKNQQKKQNKKTK